MKFSIHAQAREEFFASTAFYEQHKAGLGERFAREVAATLLSIVQFPDSGANIDDLRRRKRVRRFPFVIVYRVKPDHIRILAIMHTHRHPQYWEERG